MGSAKQKCAILTMINAMLPATIVLLFNIPRHQNGFFTGLTAHFESEAAAYSINAPSNILLIMRGCCDQARDAGEQEGKHD